MGLYTTLLAVPPAHKKKGIGCRLAERCVERTREDGAQTLDLYTSELMYPARTMYEEIGFRPAGEPPPMFGVRYQRYVLDLGG